MVVAAGACALMYMITSKVLRRERAADQESERDGWVEIGSGDVASSVDRAHQSRADGNGRQLSSLADRDGDGEAEQGGAQGLDGQLLLNVRHDLLFSEACASARSLAEIGERGSLWFVTIMLLN